MMNKRTANEKIPLKHYSHAIAKTMCNPSLPSCHLGDCTECPGREPLREMLERCFNEEEIEEIEFKQWTTTDRSTLQTIMQSTDEFIESFLDKLETPRRHFIAKQQSCYLAERKEGLKEGEFLVIGDFSENFSFVVQDEAQSFHWDNGMATLHPFVYYYKDEGQICHGNFVLISDYNTHDTVAVHLFQRHLINHLQEKFQFVSNIVYFSDGCAANTRT